MTWPEYLAGVCRVDGRLRRLTYQEADVLCVLLLGNPHKSISSAEMIERMWENSDSEPATAKDLIRSVVGRLRRHGIPIEQRRDFGYRIPEHGRGKPARLPLAA
jgi:DNA-binding response OmpR family regulator